MNPPPPRPAWVGASILPQGRANGCRRWGQCRVTICGESTALFTGTLNDCWGRDRYDFCANINMELFIPGVILAFFGLLACYFGVIVPVLRRPGLLRELIADLESRLVKAACVQVIRCASKKGVKKSHSVFSFKHVFLL